MDDNTQKNQPGNLREFPENLSHPFDGLCKAVFSQTTDFQHFLEAIIEEPGPLQDWFYGKMPARITPCKTNFVRQDFRQKHMDMLYHAEYTNIAPDLIQTEFMNQLVGNELKRLSGYKDDVVQYFSRERAGGEHDKILLPSVAQIMIYTGPKCALSEAMREATRPAKQLRNGSDYAVCFMPTYAENKQRILRQGNIGLVKLLAHAAGTGNMLQFLKKNPEVVAQLQAPAFAAHLEMVVTFAVDREKDKGNTQHILDILLDVSANKKEIAMMHWTGSWTDKIREEERQEGRQEGRKKLMQEVERRMRSRGLDDHFIRSILPTAPAFA